MITINLTSDHIEMLLKSKQTKKRQFQNWSIEGLLNEAIYEFYQKYTTDTKVE